MEKRFVFISLKENNQSSSPGFSFQLLFAPLIIFMDEDLNQFSTNSTDLLSFVEMETVWFYKFPVLNSVIVLSLL